MKTVDQYQFIHCSCGLRLKIPPAFDMHQVQCPKCGATHTI
jgi:heat shock protein HtpX